MTDEQLLRFCDRGFMYRWDLSTPFVVGGWKYATDGTCGIRVPTTEPDTDRARLYPQNAALVYEPALMLLGAIELVKFPIHNGQFVDEDCYFCGGSKTDQIDCPSCAGDGFECETCHCNGLIPLKDTVCPRCKGDGRMLELTLFAGQRFAGHYINLVNELTHVRTTNAHRGNVALPFLFGENGQGVLMPIQGQD